MKSNRGLFISFEGPEASGKSSQILLLSKYFKKNRPPAACTLGCWIIPLSVRFLLNANFGQFRLLVARIRMCTESIGIPRDIPRFLEAREDFF